MIHKVEKKSMDPLFKKRFGISTPIAYLWNVIVEPKWEEDFAKKWKRFWKKYHAGLDPGRRFQQFERFLAKLEAEQDDISVCSSIAIASVSKQVGFGVFAKRDISPYTLLNQYGGILCPDRLINEESDSVFMFSLFPSYSIDASSKGNWTRFMNHATDKKQTNVVAWEHYSSAGPRLIFTASHRGIKKGSQLLYNYGDSYWEEEAKIVSL